MTLDALKWFKDPNDIQPYMEVHKAKYHVHNKESMHKELQARK